MKKLMTNYSINENKSEHLLDQRVFLAQSVVFLLLLINAFRANTIPNIVILAVAMILPLFLKPMEIAAYIVGFAMMGTGVQVAYIAISCLVSLLLKSENKIRSLPLLSILLFVCYEVVHMMMASSDDLIEFLRYAVVYALLFYILFMNYEVEDKIRVVDSYIYGTLFGILHVFIETVRALNGNLFRLIDGSLRFGYAEQLDGALTMSADPNSLGQGCSLIIVISLMLIMLGYKKKRYYFAMFLALLAGTLTISKTFLISLILIVVLMILFVGSWSSPKMWGRRIFLLALIALGCFVVLKVNPSYIENIFSRVDESDITTGRVNNALIYLEHLMNQASHLLFGVGMQNVGEKIGFTGSPHAAIVESLICWGIFGTLCMLALLGKAVVQQAATGKPRMLNYVPLMVYCVIMQTTQLFRLRDRVFTLLVIVVTIGISKKGEQQSVCQEESTIGDQF